MQATLIVPLRERERWKKKEGNRVNEEREAEKKKAQSERDLWNNGLKKKEKKEKALNIT